MQDGTVGANKNTIKIIAQLLSCRSNFTSSCNAVVFFTLFALTVFLSGDLTRCRDQSYTFL